MAGGFNAWGLKKKYLKLKCQETRWAMCGRRPRVVEKWSKKDGKRGRPSSLGAVTKTLGRGTCEKTVGVACRKYPTRMYTPAAWLGESKKNYGKRKAKDVRSLEKQGCRPLHRMKQRSRRRILYRYAETATRPWRLGAGLEWGDGRLGTVYANGTLSRVR